MADSPRRGRGRPPPTPVNGDDPSAALAPEIWTADRVLQAVRDLAKIQSSSKRAMEANRLIEHIEPADAPLLAPKLAQLPADRAIETLFVSVMEMWAQFEPEQAFRFAMTLQRPGLRYQSMTSVMATWVDSDVQAATKYIESQPPGAVRGELIALVLHGTAEQDPERALALMKKVPPVDGRDGARRVFMTWAMNDLDGAVKAAMALGEPRERIAAMESVISEWSSHDPSAALDWAVKHNSEPGNVQVVEQAFSSAAAERPDLAAAYIAKLDDGVTRDGVIGSLAQHWVNEDREAAKRWAMSLDDNDRTLAIDGMVNALSYDDPVAAFELVKSIDDPARRGRSLQGVIMSWAEHDPDEAWKQAQELEPGREKEETLATVISARARTNPIAAAEALTELPDSPANIRASTDIARAWGQIDPQSALRWVERLPAGESRNLAASQVASIWVQSDPEAATAWAERSGDEAIKRDLAFTWATNDPQSAVEWSMDHAKPTGADRNTVFEQTMAQWAANDSRRAAQWAQSLPRGRNRDMAYEQLSESTLYNDPETSMTYVDQIGDKKLRNEVRSRMYTAFKENDAKKAERWRSSARLSPDELQAMDAPPPDEPPEPGSDGKCVCPPASGP